MKLPSVREMWGHEDDRVREFGKAFFVVLVIFGALAARSALNKLGAAPLDGALRMAVAWEAAKLWWLSAWAVLTFATAFPWFTRPVYVLMNLVGMSIGFVFGHVVLGMMWIGMFATIGYMRRATSPVQMRFDKQAQTYWKKHATVKSPDRYYRQW